jgi:hypothetical protein
MKKILMFVLCIAMIFVATGCAGGGANADGFVIENSVLTAYEGEAEEVVVPEEVTVIATSAFSGDYDHGINLVKVTIPGTVKNIETEAFAFTNADIIVIEEGVESIGDYAFMDSYIKEIHFPASLTDIGTAIMETEEGLWDTAVYVPKDSAVESYMKENPPYGEITLNVE